MQIIISIVIIIATIIIFMDLTRVRLDIIAMIGQEVLKQWHLWEGNMEIKACKTHHYTWRVSVHNHYTTHHHT